MTRRTLALIMAASLTASACLDKDTTSTMYLRQDGSFDWVILEQSVRSDERDESSRLAEEAGYVDGLSRGDSDMINSLLALGAEDVHVRWLRRTRPYAVMVDARFDSVAGVFGRALASCGLPYESAITETGEVTTWRLRIDVGPEGSRLDQGGGEDCGNGLNDLTDALDELRIVLEAGSFTAWTGFTITNTDTASVDEKAVEESVRSTGVVELSLSWTTR